MNSHLSGKQGQHCYEMNLDGAYGQLKDKVKDIQDIWKPHAESGCSVCELYTSQKHPRPLHKKKREGSIRLAFDTSSSDIFAKLFSHYTAIKVLNYDIKFPDSQKCHYTCSICQEILSTRSVSTGCHHFCSSCLSSVFTVNCVNNASCPVCYKDIHVDNVAAVDEAFRNILKSLPVVCNSCQREDTMGVIAEHD